MASDNSLLENLFLSNVKLDPKKDKKHVEVLNAVLDKLISTAKDKSPEFKQVFSKIYYGGSYYEDLKVKSTPFEYDLNIIFKKPNYTFTVCNLGRDYRKPHFATICTNHHEMSQVWSDLTTRDSQGSFIISPGRMFKLLQTSVDKAITELESRVSHAGQQYKVTRSVGGAPVVLNVKGPDDVFFTADLVPAFEMPMPELKICCRELYDRVQEMFRERHVDFVKEFLMVALKDADKDSFEINFHKSEKELLSRTGGCVKKVIMLIKYLRDMKGGTTLKLWSHLLKVN